MIRYAVPADVKADMCGRGLPATTDIPNVKRHGVTAMCFQKSKMR